MIEKKGKKRSALLLSGIGMLFVSALGFAEPVASSVAPLPTPTPAPVSEKSPPVPSNLSSKSLSSSQAKQPVPAYTYITDDETKQLTRAVSDYNQQNPEEPIKELSEDAYRRLVKYGFLKVVPKSTVDLVLRNGEVMRKIKKDPQEPTGDDSRAGESLSGTVEASTKVVEGLHVPRGIGNPSRISAVEVKEHGIQVKIDGSYKEIQVTTPKLPSPRKTKEPEGTFVKPRGDLLQNSLGSQNPVAGKTSKETQTRPQGAQ